MDNKILNGRLVSDYLYKNLKKKYDILVEEKKRKATLVFIIIGEDESSKIYIKNKEKKCNEFDINQKTISLDYFTTEDELIKIIEKLNQDQTVDGILLQLPLPNHINYDNITSKISRKKDVDGFHSENIGNLLYSKDSHYPCTPSGIMEILKYYNINVKGEDVVIIGRSNIVGKPMALMMINEGATVQVCNSNTKNLKEKTKLADILIVAAGSPKLINKDDVKDGVIIIDVGINRLSNKIVGDVNFSDVIEKVKYITPVPGGIGPMTIYSLIKNTVESFSKSDY